VEPQLDEVARQRQKHRAASLSQPVAGFPAMTVFLRSSGHSHETIESVLRCLDLDPRETPDPQEAPAQKDEVCAALHPSSGQRRLRTLAQLEAMLLKD